MEKLGKYDVIIIGGSYAGLSAGMALGRSLRKVLIIDSGSPCNQQTPHSHNFITQDGQKPSVIANIAKEQVLQYPTVEFIDAFATNASRNGKSFVIQTDRGEQFESDKLLFATGIKDIMPAIGGFADAWAKSIVHCPYCHGYEIRNKKTGILLNGARAFHMASLLNNLTDQITILTAGKPDFTEEQLAKFEMHHIAIVEKKVKEIEQLDGQIAHVIFEDHSRLALGALYAGLPFEQHSEIPKQLGCETTEEGYIKVDGFQRTTVDGIFACGDNSSMMRSVSNAVATGGVAGAMLNKELVDDRF